MAKDYPVPAFPYVRVIDGAVAEPRHEPDCIAAIVPPRRAFVLIGVGLVLLINRRVEYTPTAVAMTESDRNRGVRLLGRSSAPEIIGLVREHLIDELDSTSKEKPARLRLVSDHEESATDREPKTPESRKEV